MAKFKEAMYYKKDENGSVQCFLCPHNCKISSGNVGICGVRKNNDGILHSLNYEIVSSVALDPIEKKPLREFYPGSYILSVGSIGCNFKCPFCQNHSIAQVKVDESSPNKTTSREIVKKAIELKSKGNIGIAFTYNEPSIWYEFVYETAKLSKENDLKNVLVTNGYISREPLEELLPCIDAMNIDLKAFQDRFYRSVVKGGLEEVKTTIEIASKKCHVEVTTLVIPNMNDSVEEISELAKWLSSVSPDIPLHLSAFYPRYKLTDRSATTKETLKGLEKSACKYLKSVYLGNV